MDGKGTRAKAARMLGGMRAVKSRWENSGTFYGISRGKGWKGKREVGEGGRDKGAWAGEGLMNDIRETFFFF